MHAGLEPKSAPSDFPIQGAVGERQKGELGGEGVRPLSAHIPGLTIHWGGARARGKVPSWGPGSHTHFQGPGETLPGRQTYRHRAGDQRERGRGRRRREGGQGWRDRGRGDAERGPGRRCAPPGQTRGAAPKPPIPEGPKASPSASGNSVTGTQPQRRPRLQGNPGKPRAPAPLPGAGRGARGEGPARGPPLPLQPPPSSSSPPLSHAPNPPGLFPTLNPAREGRGKRGEPHCAPPPGPGSCRPALICVSASLAISPSLLSLVSHDLHGCVATSLSLGASKMHRAPTRWRRDPARGDTLGSSAHSPPPPTPAKFGPRWRHTEGAEVGAGQAEGRCQGACQGSPCPRTGGSGSEKGSAWSRSPGEEVGVGTRPRVPATPGLPGSASLGERLRSRQHSRDRDMERDTETIQRP